MNMVALGLRLDICDLNTQQTYFNVFSHDVECCGIDDIVVQTCIEGPLKLILTIIQFFLRSNSLFLVLYDH